MKRHSILLASIILGLIGFGTLLGCSEGQKQRPPLVCQWSIITMQGGISVVRDGNPSEKDVKGLIGSGVGFSQRVEKEIVCKAEAANNTFISNQPTPTTAPPKTDEGTWAYNY